MSSPCTAYSSASSPAGGCHLPKHDGQSAAHKGARQQLALDQKGNGISVNDFLEETREKD